jgi:putative oxidoreductase
MAYGILLLRVVVGLAVAAHGAQKLFGWFGGGGLRGTAGFFGQLGFRPPLAMAALAGLAELGGGLLLAFGLATPLAAFAIAVVMLNAIWAVHWKNGFWNSSGGYELNLIILAVVAAVTAAGAGRFSLDHLFGWADEISGLWWAVGVVAAALVTAVATRVRREQPAEVAELRRAA